MSGPLAGEVAHDGEAAPALPRLDLLEGDVAGRRIADEEHVHAATGGVAFLTQPDEDPPAGRGGCLGVAQQVGEDGGEGLPLDGELDRHALEQDRRRGPAGPAAAHFRLDAVDPVGERAGVDQGAGALLEERGEPRAVHLVHAAVDAREARRLAAATQDPLRGEKVGNQRAEDRFAGEPPQEDSLRPSVLAEPLVGAGHRRRSGLGEEQRAGHLLAGGRLGRGGEYARAMFEDVVAQASDGSRHRGVEPRPPRERTGHALAAQPGEEEDEQGQRADSRGGEALP